MIYAPPELAKHRAALERLRRTDATIHEGRPQNGSIDTGSSLNPIVSTPYEHHSQGPAASSEVS